MKTRHFLVFLLPFFLGLSQLQAATKISCSHPELCRLAQVIFAENHLNNFEFETLVNIKGDPHEFEPSMSEIKDLIKAEILISGPVELNPWIKKINYQRSKLGNLKTINLPLNKKDYALYPTTNNDPLSHFWLYPKIFCVLKNNLEEQLIALGHLIVISKNKSCPTEAQKVTTALQSTLKEVGLSIVLTHDALLPLLQNLTSMDPNNKISIVAVKGSGHHQEASPLSVKKLYDVLKAPQVLWIIEDKIFVPQNILKKKRSSDPVILLDTANSQGKDYFQILWSLNEKLKAQKK